MSDGRPGRGDIYTHAPAGRTRHLLVISVDMLTEAGTAIVVQVDDTAPQSGLQALLVVPLDGDWDGWHVKAWHLNYINTDRLAAGGKAGAVDADTLHRVILAVKAAIEP